MFSPVEFGLYLNPVTVAGEPFRTSSIPHSVVRAYHVFVRQILGPRESTSLAAGNASYRCIVNLSDDSVKYFRIFGKRMLQRTGTMAS